MIVVTRMLRRIWNRLKPLPEEDWSVVAILRHTTYWTDAKSYDYTYYTLLSSDSGKRKCRTRSTSALLERDEKRRQVYICYVEPWMDGHAVVFPEDIISVKPRLLQEEPTRDGNVVYLNRPDGDAA
jgi:hypothetical protein